jgi:hypothetical protein
VVRYFSRHGGKEFSKAVLIASVTPFQLQIQSKVFLKKEYDGMAKLIKETDSVFDNFGKTFFGVSFINISTPLLDYYRMLCSLHHHVLL